MIHRSVSFKWRAVSFFVFDFFLQFFNEAINISVSHTTDDMIFQWDPDVPLVVDEHIG